MRVPYQVHLLFKIRILNTRRMILKILRRSKPYKILELVMQVGYGFFLF